MHCLVRPLALALLLGVVFAGCGPSTGTISHCGAHCTEDLAHAKILDGGVDGGGDANVDATLTLIVISPADQAINLTLGTTQNVTYSAMGTFSDNSMSALSGTWALADSTIGTIDAVSGTFTANGIVGGTTQVQFTLLGGVGVNGATSVTVNLSTVVMPSPAPSVDPRTLFAAAGTPVTDVNGQATILYPLDKVVFPQNVNAPLVQWKIGDGSTTGGATDWYRITYVKPNITVTQYVQSATLSSALDETIFSRIAETDPSISASLTVDRLDVAGSRVMNGPPVHLSFATGSVSGTVYYWAMDEHRLHRIQAGTTNNQPLFPPSIVGTASTDPGYTYGDCIACHQISRDGRYLAANGDQAYLFDLTAADPTMSNMPVATRANYRWYFATMSPDDKRIFATSGDAHFLYTDFNVADVTPTGTVPSPSSVVAHPSWSPDGKNVAFISNVVNWTSIASFTGGDLTTVGVDSTTDVFTNLQVIHTGSALSTSDPAGGDADCFPTWTPDSRYLMFAHTANTRGTVGRVDGSMYMMTPKAGVEPVRLATASDADGRAQSHYPNLSPFISGGYYWAVFYSTRDYGNAQAGTAGKGRPQLWVTAIGTSFNGTNDPSAVPYWLPGQDTQHENADAVWAASLCSSIGTSCSTTSDCCSGACQPGDGGYVCAPPQACRQEGQSCSSDSDCCGNGEITCDLQIHTCQFPPPS